MLKLWQGRFVNLFGFPIRRYELLCAALPCKELFALRLVCTSAKMDTNREIEDGAGVKFVGPKAM